MKLLKNFTKKIKYSFVMGRLSKKIGDKYQHFPIDNFQNEIESAKKFNFVNSVILIYLNYFQLKSFYGFIKKKFHNIYSSIKIN